MVLRPFNMGVFDVIVVGGGHAGCEAAAAAARVGARTLLLTQKLETVGELSCNPSIGGVGKGHLVREIDALDGLMGKVADMAAIQFRMLNRSKGPAVRGPRAQMDRGLYRQHMQAALHATKGLEMRAGSVEDLLLKGSTTSEFGAGGGAGAGTPSVRGVRLKCGSELQARHVVLTTGTFLRGLIHRGRAKTPAGRAGDAPSVGLALTLEKLGFPLGRLKTGTPPRLLAATIDWAQAQIQLGDHEPSPFSFSSCAQNLPALSVAGGQKPCWQVQTSHEAQAVVAEAYRNGLAPWFQGDGEGEDGADGRPKMAPKGPRYCMSIETKVQRFPEVRLA
eukprot:SAG11_NODE_1147_length_5683_cov_40.952006_6_plen_334_part_00